jgi:hypothetical protein
VKARERFRIPLPSCARFPQRPYYIYTAECHALGINSGIYNGPTLMELFTATEKLKKFILTTRDVRCVHHEWHGTHRYDNQVLAIHASTWVHRYSSLLPRSVPKMQRGHVVIVGRTCVPTLSRDPPYLKARVIVTVKNIGAPMLTRVWQEI